MFSLGVAHYHQPERELPFTDAAIGLLLAFSVSLQSYHNLASWIISSVLQSRKVRFTRVKWLFPSQRVKKWQTWDRWYIPSSFNNPLIVFEGTINKSLATLSLTPMHPF